MNLYYKLINIAFIVSNLVIIGKSEIKGLQYILLWANSGTDTFMSLKMGQQSFIENKCLNQNCFITSNFSLPFEITQFDAIVFNPAALQKKNPTPTKRSMNQKYVFASTESSAKYPLTASFNNFFNWTWTYKLDSDVVNSKITIRDKAGHIIGPKKDMQWIAVDEMEDIDDHIKDKLGNKTTAAAWFVTDCEVIRHYESYIKELRFELDKYNLSLDLLSLCGDVEDAVPCSKNNEKECFDLIQSSYCFYLAFEDAMSEDYVTEQLLIALNNFAVPVVFGGANYTRFMPEGIYLDAFELGPAELASKMSTIIDAPSLYYNMFKWHKYYRYHNPLERPDSNSICNFCQLLNDDRKRSEITMYENIVKWYNERKDWNNNPKPTVKYEVTRWVNEI